MSHPLNKSRTGGWALLLAWTLATAGCHRHEPPPPSATLPALPVQAGTVRAAPQEEFERVMGTVRPKLKALIAAKVSGRISQMPVETGQKVAKDTLMIALDAQEIQARQNQAHTLLDQANIDLQRFTALRKQEAVTQAELDAVQARHGVAEAAVLEAQSMMDYTVIRAPFDGVITRKLAEIGDLAVPGKPLLELEDPTTLRLEAEVPEGLVARVELNSKLQAVIAHLDRSFPATVTEIAPAGDPSSRTFLVKLDLPPSPALRTGQYGQVEIPTGRSMKIMAPSSSVVRKGQLEMVFVIRERTAVMRLVKTGKVWQEQVEVLSGVQADDQIVLDPPANLRDGQPVTLSP